MLQIRPYQREALDAVYDYFGHSDGNPLVVMPTGTGKSVVIAKFHEEAMTAWPDTRILNLTHVSELIDQNHRELLGMWPAARAGIYSAGLRRRETGHPIVFAGIQSVYKRAAEFGHRDLILIDEAHTVSRKDGGMYRRFLADMQQINPALKVVGLTATAYRMDSGLLHEGDDRLFTDVAYEYPMIDAIRDGYLVPLVPKRTSTALDVSGVGTRGGEFIQSQLEDAVDIDGINKAIAAEIVQYGQDRGSWLVFCVGVQHAQHMRDAIRAHGVSCEMVHKDTSAADRRRFVERFRRGDLRCLTNVGVFTTGFNAPGVDLIGLCRPTKSPGLYVQILGRGTRLAEGKEDCRVLDFAGNVVRHGPVDTVTGSRGKNKGGEGGVAPTRVCAECNTINHAAARICVGCGFEFPAPESALEATADASPILSTQIKAEWVPVDDVIYTPHVKPDKPHSMRVSYRCGLTHHDEWVCFDHTGYPRDKAEGWWAKRAPGTMVPANTFAALRRTQELARPTAIQVQRVGKYTEIRDAKLQ